MVYFNLDLIPASSNCILISLAIFSDSKAFALCKVSTPSSTDEKDLP